MLSSHLKNPWPWRFLLNGLLWLTFYLGEGLQHYSTSTFGVQNSAGAARQKKRQKIHKADENGKAITWDNSQFFFSFLIEDAVGWRSWRVGHNIYPRPDPPETRPELNVRVFGWEWLQVNYVGLGLNLTRPGKCSAPNKSKWVNL